MVDKRRVLVVPAGTELGLEARESLTLSKHWSLVGANSIDDHSQVAYPKVIAGLPYADQAGFVDAVRELAESERADFVIPAHDEAIYALAGEPLGKAIFVGPDRPLADILRFKSRTYAALSGVVACPRVYEADAIATADLPLFAKPDRGQGSRGARRLSTLEDLTTAKAEAASLVISELMPGPEYTVDCFTNRHGALLYAAPRRRTRISNGISVRSEAVEDDRLTRMAERINAALQIRGAWFFQVKETANGEPKLLEVANRVAGAMGFQRERGVNLVEAWLHDLLDRDIELPSWSHGPIIYDRALAARVAWSYRPETVYVDFDDTLLLDSGRVNYRLVGNLFGLKFNLGARLVLITRHKADIGLALRRLALAELFDEVRHLTAGEPKSEAIEPGRAILVDDSFAERAEVAKRRAIPTFPLEAMACIEGLNHAALGDD